MKKLIFIVLILVNVQVVHSKITDALFMTIGNKPITQSDLVDEIKILLILNNESYSADKKDQLNDNLKYESILAWDSVGHMTMIGNLEDAFDIVMEMDDIIDFSSFNFGKKLLKKYKVEI